MSSIALTQYIMIIIMIVSSILLAIAIYYKTRPYGDNLDKFDENSFRYFRILSYMVFIGVIFFYSPVFILGMERGLIALGWEFYGLSFVGCLLLLICQILVTKNIWKVKQRIDLPFFSPPFHC